MKINNIQKVILLTLISTFLLVSCAKIVAPTGGPKDEQHPLIVESNPPSHSVNFDKEQIKISFDEFIQIKDLKQNLIISPPIEEDPLIQEKGKTLSIKFLSELKDSTTYNIYFGNSVQDYNEGNPIENFQYVLSTGEFIDSLSIEGIVLNSFNLLPEEDVYVMLYNEYEDSIPIKRIPDYISKTNEEGHFRINNISHNKYKLFCLRDANRNYLFDKPGEDIAYIDSLIQFELIIEEKFDTIYQQDTLIHEIENDSIEEPQRTIDTIIYDKQIFYPVHNFILRLFNENKKVQYLASYNRDVKQKIVFLFNKPIKDSLTLTLLDTVVYNDWYIQETNLTNDTIFYWITDSLLYNKEELSVKLEYFKEDSNMVYQWVSDTLKLQHFAKKERGSKNDVNPDTLIKYSHNLSNKPFDLNRKISFDFEKPILPIDTTKISLYQVIDSLEIPVNYSIQQDTFFLRKHHLSPTKWAEDTIYKLEIMPEAFTDIYGLANDTSIIEFKTQEFEYYGKLLVDITGIDSSYQLICQLILPEKEEENVLKEKIITANQMIEFPFLEPKEYIFKVILDKNFNDQWDPGNYLKHIQPEEVLYYDSEIKIRSNWDMEINFDVNKGLKEE